MSASPKYPMPTVEVVATTSPPAPGFMASGQRIEEGERVRLPRGDALILEKCGKARVVAGSEKTEMM